MQGQHDMALRFLFLHLAGFWALAMRVQKPEGAHPSMKVEGLMRVCLAEGPAKEPGGCGKGKFFMDFDNGFLLQESLKCQV